MEPDRGGAEVVSEVCPGFFDLGQGETLQAMCTRAGLAPFASHRLEATLAYDGANDACGAMLLAGPAALAWSRFDDDTRDRVCQSYLASIDAWWRPEGYRVPAEFVVVGARRN